MHNQWYYFTNDITHSTDLLNKGYYRDVVAGYVHYYKNGSIAPVKIDKIGKMQKNWKNIICTNRNWRHKHGRSPHALLSCQDGIPGHDGTETKTCTKTVIANNIGHTYHTRTIITRGLYIFYPIFHCCLYCRVVSVADSLFSKQGNHLISGSKFCGLQLRAVQFKSGLWLSAC